MTGRRALLVACADYEDPEIGRLRTPANDIQDVGRVLADPQIGGFALTPSLDQPEATVRRTLGRFLREARRTDVVLLYFACHGFKDDDGRLYLAARDTELADVPATGLPADLVNRLIDLSPCRQTVLILDCCFSGAIAQGLDARDLHVVPVGEVFGGRGEGRVIITASRATEYAYEPAAGAVALRSDSDLSVFAAAFVEGLRTGAADADGDGLVSASELYDFIHDRVIAAAPAQTPGLWNRAHGKLIIAHRAPAALAPATVPARLPPARSPFDPELLSWPHAATASLQNAFASVPPTVRHAWRMANNGNWDVARPIFQRTAGDGAGDAEWWGFALCEAVEGRWQSAGIAFEQAAKRATADQPALYAGAALLAAVTLRAAQSTRWHEPLDRALDRTPFCPEILAYRGVQLDDAASLSLSVQLAPDLIGQFAAVGVVPDQAVSAALEEADQRLAMLVRARAAADTALRRLRGGLQPPAVGGAGPGRTAEPAVATASQRAQERMRLVSKAIETERAGLAERLGALQVITQDLLGSRADAATMIRIRVLRRAAGDIIVALRETDRPAPVRAFGIPPRVPTFP